MIGSIVKRDRRRKAAVNHRDERLKKPERSQDRERERERKKEQESIARIDSFGCNRRFF
jgi:hypothetical protein